MIAAEACSRIIKAYDAQGWHRTATAVDHASARWLIDELHSRNVQGALETFPFTRVDPEPCSVQGDGWTVQGHPFTDSLLPSPGNPLKGRFAERPDTGAFALVHADAHGMASPIDPLREQPWAAIIAILDGPGFTLRNQWRQDEPYGPPVVQVPASSAAQLEQARQCGEELTIHCGAVLAPTEASNVIATVPGSDPSLAPITVLTPRSGWWHCAGERGGGIAVWLEVAGEARRLGLSRTVNFVASTGHELNFWGARQHIARHPGLGPASRFWVHLGANIGARGTTLMTVSSDRGLLDIARSAGDRSGMTADEVRWEFREHAPGGEAQVIERAGGTFLSLIGANPQLFHSTEDRWPQAIDSEAIARAANLVVETLLASEPGGGSGQSAPPGRSRG